MSTLYLHIGTQKTGTTSLQYFLRKNHRILEKYGFSYPIFNLDFTNVGKRRNAHFMIMRYFYENGRRNTQQEYELQQKGYAWLLEELSQNENVILSDEAIWYSCDYIENFWENLGNLLENAGHTLKVIVYFRRQDLFIQSYWMHKVREDEIIPFLTYVKKEKYAFSHLDYYTHLEDIASVTGRDSILVRVYEKEQYKGNGGTIFSDFLDTIGLELTDEYKMPEEDLNQSIDLICAETKRILNTIPGFAYRRNFLVDYMRKVSVYNKENGQNTNASLFPPDERTAFLGKYSNENQMIAKSYLHRADGRLFYEPLPDDAETVNSFSTKELVANCGQIILTIMEDVETLTKENQEFRQRIDCLEKSLPNRILHKINKFLSYITGNTITR